jgi:hypothetical protein
VNLSLYITVASIHIDLYLTCRYAVVCFGLSARAGHGLDRVLILILSCILDLLIYEYVSRAMLKRVILFIWVEHV